MSYDVSLTAVEDGSVALTVEPTDEITLVVETGPSGTGVPPGGTTSQQLQKASDSDFDIVWANSNAHVHAASTVTFTPAGTIAAVQVQAAIEEVASDAASALSTEVTNRTNADTTLQTNIDNHLNDTTDAHDASAISVSAIVGLTATEVQAAISELHTDVDSKAATTALTAHIDDTDDAHDASAISISAIVGMTAANVQAAIAELDSEKALASDLTAHTGTVSGNPHGVTHAMLSDKGTNAHAAIDTHLGATASNPHGVTHAMLSDKGTNAHAAIDTHLAATDVHLTTAAQTITGVKTFATGTATSREDVASALAYAEFTYTKQFVKLTGTNASVIHGITAGSDGKVFTLYNATNQTITLKHESLSATAANRLKLPGASDLSVTADSSVELIYDTGASRWVIKSGSGSAAASSGGGALSVTGSSGSPQAITAAGGIAFTGSSARQMWFIYGSGGAVEVSANPQIAAAGTVGQELILVGRHDTNTVTLNTGNGLDLNGPWVGGSNSILALVWNGSTWLELYRR